MFNESILLAQATGLCKRPQPRGERMTPDLILNLAIYLAFGSVLLATSITLSQTSFVKIKVEKVRPQKPETE